ncbi:hypothetical protein [Phenylobacterium sp.]|uniref:hypothetical protein n=1 Tax=Phenylobacterium sp. TaxID=1871053 RepID=UPI0025D2C6D9|nr:hypothetical protein [Phenylobacterium sp.]MBX3482556.1 hypothetical protein [Phenylobacterium sp.]MCW5758764.1 hypothetical protein [Phenylobacterium sp.]
MTLDEFKIFVADLARPFSIYAAALSGGYATAVIAHKVTTAEGGALVLGVLAGWGTALYAGKVYEKAAESRNAAEVEKVRAQASPPPAEALKPADPAEERSLEDPA